ncbi:MAG: ATPase domain-containing protein, partial [Hyphomicrobiaceae bacterium]
MAKPARNAFVCQTCGATASRWAGKCPECGDWNTLVEEASGSPPTGSGIAKASPGRKVVLETLAGETAESPRFSTGLAELDRVTGGGVVPGSALLIGGEPGIGKSTLLLQLSAAVANSGRRALYFSGEEAAAQVRLRADRLGLREAPVALAAETNLSNIL